MCYSINSSYFNWLKTFFTAILILLFYNDYDTVWVVSFILTFTLMQTYEAIAWANLDYINNNKKMNFIIIFLLMLQPIVNILFAYNKSKNNKLLYLLSIFIIFLLFLYSLDRKINIKPGVNGHLTWLDDNNDYVFKYLIIGFVFLIGLTYPFLYLDNDKIKYPLISFVILSYLYSVYNFSKTNEISSYWCYIATNLILLFLILKIFNK
jgi:hypothetical protein